MNIFQHTIKNTVLAQGIGLHTGKDVTIAISPAPENSGISFHHKGHGVIVPANYKYISNTSFATTIGKSAAAISTVEHLMAAFAGLSIDNAVVEIDGPEVPAMDGSAYPFVKLLHKAGLKAQSAPRNYLEVLDEITVSQGDKYISLCPFGDVPAGDAGLAISLTIDFDHAAVQRQSLSTHISSKEFETKICKARTFGFLHEVEALQKNGLARGGSLENAVVIGQEGVLNRDGLRFSDEFVRHKLLDMLGDLYLIGMPIIGRVTACKSGHALHKMLVEKLMHSPNAWRVKNFESIAAPIFQDGHLAQQVWPVSRGARLAGRVVL
jgi:UDP-3-O-[3-hydroxymyristoyl] N-acetylglucosamine deacetylase